MCSQDTQNNRTGNKIRRKENNGKKIFGLVFRHYISNFMAVVSGAASFPGDGTILQTIDDTRPMGCCHVGPGIAAIIATVFVAKQPFSNLRLNTLGPKRFYL